MNDIDLEEARATVVFGARCTWWDTLDQAGDLPLGDGACESCGKRHQFGIPPACTRGDRRARRCCPYCRGPIEIVKRPSRWWDGVEAFPVLQFARGRCYPTMEALEAAHATAGVEA